MKEFDEGDSNIAPNSALFLPLCTVVGTAAITGYPLLFNLIEVVAFVTEFGLTFFPFLFVIQSEDVSPSVRGLITLEAVPALSGVLFTERVA